MVRNNPLFFQNLANEWLAHKQPKMKPGGWQSIKALMGHAIKEWDGVYIKKIDYAAMDDFFNDLPFASKTKHNLLTTLKQFWRWAARRYKIDLPEDWPDIGVVSMKYRKMVT